MIVFACGLSKSGKSTLISQSNLARVQAEHVKASEILKKLNRPTMGLAVDDVLTNQLLLVNWLMQSLHERPRPIILDGHLVLETTDGPQLVPDRVLEPLPITGVIMIHDNPMLVAERRKGSGLTTCIEAIRDLTIIEDCHGRLFARHKKVGFDIVEANDIARFQDVIVRWIKNDI